MDKNLDKKTEDQILNAAYRVILQKGKAGSRMQEIADEAGVNKALLHYYFRSKDKIYTAVVQRILKELLRSVIGKIDFASPYEKLIKDFVRGHIRTLQNNSRIVPFFFSELQFNAKEIAPVLKSMLNESETSLPNLFYSRTQKAIEDLEIRPVDPNHLLINIISLDVFYFLAGPVFTSVLNISEKDHKDLTEKRADEVSDFIWEAIRLKEY